MKVLFVSTSGGRGGAGIAAQRIARAVRARGIDVSMLTSDLSAGDDLVVGNVRWASAFPILDKLYDRLPVLAYRNRNKLLREINFSAAVPMRDWSGIVNELAPEVVHLHWINYGMISPEGLGRIHAPVVWTLHDMWAFTGGCHHSGTCERFAEQCGTCPVLGSRSAKDISHRIWQRKKTAWENVSIEVATPSGWMAQRAARSSLFGGQHITQIANPLDLDFFCPGDAATARQRLGLPLGVPLVLFCANKALQTTAKGYSHLMAALALEVAASPAATPHAVVVGTDTKSTETLPNGVTVHMLGYVSGPQAMVQIYRAVDVIAVTSRNENLPNTIAEAMACGIPCAAFGVGGIPEMIDHAKTGYVVKPQDDADLAAGLRFCIDANRDGRELGRGARIKAEAMFDSQTIAESYITLYQRALSADGNRARRAGPK